MGTSPTELDALRETVSRLEREQAWSRTLLETVPAVVMRVSLEGVIEFINRVLPEYSGSPPTGQSIYTFAPADQHEVMRSAIARAARTLQPSSYESVALAPDGTRDWYVTSVGPILDEGRLVGFALVSTNASRAHQAEEALMESRARLEVALDAANMGLWRWDQQTDAVEWDEKLSAMFGLTAERSPRTVAEFMALIPDEQKEAMGAHIQRALETGVYPDFELGLVRPEGPRWFIIKGGVVRNVSQEVTGLLGGVVDVTERRRIDDHLRQTQKLEAVGQLSAGVAHNFNNMLAVIIPSLELARANARVEDAELLGDALTSAANAAQLVRELMIFSRSRPRAPSSQEPLAAVVRRAVELCRRTFERSVTLELGDLDAARFAGVESGPMEQAVMNLLLNARDALTPGRPARIEVSARRVEEREVARRHVEARGGYVELRVVDTGCGIDAGTQRRMFEPFFTTKTTGRGTGLGLSTVWATVQAHRGFLECDSEVGRGTTLSLLLPARDAPVEAVAVGLTPARSVGRGRVVLIIDDEPGVRRANGALLTAAGFNVVFAASGEEGLQVAAATPIDLALLDYSMPGLSPQDTLAGLRRARPGLPVVCLSGLGLTLEGATAQLVKPVSGESLVAALESALVAR